MDRLYKCFDKFLPTCEIMPLLVAYSEPLLPNINMMYDEKYVLELAYLSLHVY
jgi:hypothetical protein